MNWLSHLAFWWLERRGYLDRPAELKRLITETSREFVKRDLFRPYGSESTICKDCNIPFGELVRECDPLEGHCYIVEWWLPRPKADHEIVIEQPKNNG